MYLHRIPLWLCFVAFIACQGHTFPTICAIVLAGGFTLIDYVRAKAAKAGA
jgi:hypothetical protein